MAISVEIDPGSGFCGGVIRAVSKAEDVLSESGGKKLYSLGSIVHNESELERLRSLGLVTVSAEDLETLPRGSRVLIRAHGEPPATYRAADRLGLEVMDCTCPVVLKLQKSIREAYVRVNAAGGRILIFGKVGHAEVLGLLGQVDGDALVIENMQMLDEAISSGKINLDAPVEIFSQTTKSPAEYASICCALEEAMAKEHEMSPVLSRELNFWWCTTPYASRLQGAINACLSLHCPMTSSYSCPERTAPTARFSVTCAAP